jgi:hypothetical protein
MLNLNEEELQVFIGILMMTGIMKAPSYRLYWSSSLRYQPIATAINRDRFEEIKRLLHFKDNTKQPPANHPSYDKLYKI